MGLHRDRMYTPLTTQDRMDDLVTAICDKTKLSESTVRDLLECGWVWHEDKWVKHKPVVTDYI